eukprot:m.276177 g.276177  ORF g.276177 m.276177 type:complete len:623 (-) comp16140_c0_seq2:5277-7145(-)
MPRPKNSNRKIFTISLVLDDRTETQELKDCDFFTPQDVWALILEKFGPPSGRVFIQGHSGAAADLPTYVVEEDSFYLSFNNNKQGLPIKELKREGEYRVRLESGHRSPLPLKDIARGFTLLTFARELEDPAFRSRRYGADGYLADRCEDHDIVEWIASEDLEGAGQGVRLVLGFTPDELVVVIDCSRVSDNLVTRIIKPTEPVPLVGSEMDNPLGILVTAGVKDLVSALPLNTLIDLAEGAGENGVPKSGGGDGDAKAKDEAGVGKRRSIVFVGHSLSGCVAHATALLVNAGKPPAHDDRPLARSVAFGSPPCFTVGTGPKKLAKALMLQMTTILRQGDPMFKLLTMYQMAIMAMAVDQGTFPLQELAAFVSRTYHTARTQPLYTSAADTALLKKTAQMVGNFYRKEGQAHLAFMQVGGFKHYKPGDEVFDCADRVTAAMALDNLETHLIPKNEANFMIHYEVAWGRALCQGAEVWGERVPQETCTEVADLLSPKISACKIVVSSGQVCPPCCFPYCCSHSLAANCTRAGAPRGDSLRGQRGGGDPRARGPAERAHAQELRPRPRRRKPARRIPRHPALLSPDVKAGRGVVPCDGAGSAGGTGARLEVGGPNLHPLRPVQVL